MRLFLCLASLFLASCGGLDPNEVPVLESALRGTVTYVGGAAAWPTDTIYDLRVVAFERKPTVPEDVIASILSQTAAFTDQTMPMRTDASTYEIPIKATPRTFAYVVVAMQRGPNFLTDWVMLDVYTEDGDRANPATVVVNTGDVRTVNFTVDFSNLPPQPFE